MQRNKLSAKIARMNKKRISVQVDEFSVTLQTVSNFDTLLDHYADNHPNNVDLIPYFADLWPSAHALSRHLSKNRSMLKGATLMELGCGLGLPSIIAAHLGAVVTASDFHPENREFLLKNASLNNVNVEYIGLDWNGPALKREFDLIIGSDLLYDRRHISALVKCATGQISPKGTIILADPGRDALQEVTDLFLARGWINQLTAYDDIYLLTFTRE